MIGVTLMVRSVRGDRYEAMKCLRDGHDTGGAMSMVFGVLGLTATVLGRGTFVFSSLYGTGETV